MSRKTPISSDDDEEDNRNFSTRSKSGGAYGLNAAHHSSSDSETYEDKNHRSNIQYRTQHSQNTNRSNYSSDSETYEDKNHRSNIQYRTQHSQNTNRSNYSSSSDTDDDNHSTKTRIERNSSRTNYESDHDLHRKNNVGTPEEFSPLKLVSVLEKSKKYKENIFELIEEYNVSPKYLKAMLKDNTQTFHLDEGGEVRLKPGIKVCKDYNDDGCRSRKKCQDFHICMEYIYDKCSDKSCVLGHKFDTNHNQKMLQNYHLQNVAPKVLKELMQLNSKGSPTGLNSPLKICKSYNKKLKCDQRSCPSLHICYSFVTNRTKCQNHNCKLNHNIFEDSCKMLLRKAQISTNESPCDVLDAVAKRIGISENSYSDKKQNKSSKGSDKKHVSNRNNGFSSDDETVSKKSYKSSKSTRPASSDDSEGEDAEFRRRGAKSTSENNKPKSKSVWTRHEEGNVKITEICYYSVEENEKCKVEMQGCPRLHSELHFHWQISKNGSKWLNLPKSMVIALERAYCDPKNKEITLHKIDIPNESAISDLLGSSSWMINFETFQMKAWKIYNLYSRRLSTQKVVAKTGEPQRIPSSSFIWYFLDENQKWVQYGINSQKYFVSKANSFNIEAEYNKYLNIKTKNTMTFDNNMFTYCINFDTMIQTNMKTQVVRKVRRRPELDARFHIRKK